MDALPGTKFELSEQGEANFARFEAMLAAQAAEEPSDQFEDAEE